MDMILDNKLYKNTRNMLLLLIVVSVSQITYAYEAIDSDRIKRLHTLMQMEVDEGRLAGATILVAQKGGVLDFNAFGFRDVEKSEPLKKDSIFRIYSMSKPVTGTALMMLYDQGKFGLGDPVEKYIPEFKNLRVYSGKTKEGQITTEAQNHLVTIQELMNHTGGISYIRPYGRGPVARLYEKSNMYDRGASLQQMIAKITSLPLAAQPGTQMIYSMSVDVQGYLIEAISRQSLREFLFENIFLPLGMKDTDFHVPEEKLNRFSRRYKYGKDRELISVENGMYHKKPVLHAGGSGLVSTAEDYWRFAQMHLNGGEFNGKRLLSKKSIEIMHSVNLPDYIAKQASFYPGTQFTGYLGLIDNAERSDGLPLGSVWWWGILGTFFWIDKENESVFICMMQMDEFRYHRQLQRRMRDVMYD